MSSASKAAAALAEMVCGVSDLKRGSYRFCVASTYSEGHAEVGTMCYVG
jgi:hypothetical protein